MLKAGVPLGRGIVVASAASGNAAIESSMMAKASGVLEGKPVSAVMAASGEFPATMTDMVAMGERSGDTAQMLDKAAAFCEVEAQTASKQSVVGIATAFYLLVALIIGSTVIGFWMQYAAGTASQIP